MSTAVLPSPDQPEDNRWPTARASVTTLRALIASALRSGDIDRASRLADRVLDQERPR